MEIWGHHIKKDQIIGIGPLMKNFSKDEMRRQAFNPIHLSFTLHLVAHSYEVKTDEVALGENNAEKHTYSSEMIGMWMSEYTIFYSAVIDLIKD